MMIRKITAILICLITVCIISACDEIIDALNNDKNTEQGTNNGNNTNNNTGNNGSNSNNGSTENGSNSDSNSNSQGGNNNQTDNGTDNSTDSGTGGQTDGNTTENGNGNGQTDGSTDSHPVKPEKKVYQGLINPDEIGKSPFKTHLYYGRNLLETDEEKKAYDYYINTLLNYSANNQEATWFEIDFAKEGINITESQAVTIVRYALTDDPRINIVTSTYLPSKTPSAHDKLKADSQNIVTKIYLEPGFKGMKVSTFLNTYYYPHIEEIEKNVQDILSVVKDDMTEAQIVRAVYDKYLSTIAYGERDSRGAGNIRGAFMNMLNRPDLTIRRVICQGYAVGLQYLLMRLNIDTIYVVGTGIISPGTDKKGDHAWNKIKVNGNWYGADPTHDDSLLWNSPTCKHDYFLKNDETMEIERKEGFNSKGEKVGYSSYPKSAKESFPLSETEYTKP